MPPCGTRVVALSLRDDNCPRFTEPIVKLLDCSSDTEMHTTGESSLDALLTDIEHGKVSGNHIVKGFPQKTLSVCLMILKGHRPRPDDISVSVFR